MGQWVQLLPGRFFTQNREYSTLYFYDFSRICPATECRINIQRMKDAQCIGNLGANFLGQPVE